MIKIAKIPNTEEQFVAMLNPERLRETTLTEKDFEYRNPFESDYLRVVTAAPFRRLQDKTQIFPQEKNDFVRRRLTHSVEVAAVGRRLGLLVEDALKNEGKISASGAYMTKYAHAIPTILETAGLVHDVGNPPFGHFGEDTIKQYFKGLTDRWQKQNEQIKIEQKIASLKVDKNGDVKVGLQVSATKIDADARLSIDKHAEAYHKLNDEQRADFENFDGNVQGLRILMRLGLSTDDCSFNLTMPTLATIIKYPYPAKHDIIENRHDTKKSGYFTSEKDKYEQLCKALHIKQGKRHPLVYLLEAADDIVNVTSDVEDGYRKGVISLDEIKNAMQKSGIEKVSENQIMSFLQQQANVPELDIEQEVKDELLVKEFRIRAIDILIGNAVEKFVANFEDIVRDAHSSNSPIEKDNSILGNELLSEKENPLFAELKKLQTKIYGDTQVLQSEILGGHIITEMLDMFVRSMFANDTKDKYILKTNSYEGKVYALISSSNKKVFGCKSNEVPATAYERFQLAVDYISGMTDSYIVDLYNELRNRKH